MGNIMTHNAVFIGKAGTNHEADRHRFSCSLRIDEVGDARSAVMISTSQQGQWSTGRNLRLSSLGKLEEYDLVAFHSVWNEGTTCDVYAVEFVSYDKSVTMNEWGDLNLGPTVDERLEVRLYGGWTIDVDKDHRFSDQRFSFKSVFPSEKELAAIRRDIRLGGLLG